MPMALNIQTNQMLLQERQCIETCNLDSFDAPQERILNAVTDYKPCDYSNLKAEEVRYCKTQIKQKTRQNDNCSDEIPCKGKKRSQTMALKSCDNYQENTKLQDCTKNKLKDGEKKVQEDISDYWTFEVPENVRNWESTYNKTLKKMNQYPNLDIVTSDDKRMIMARVTSTGATIKFGCIELTIPEGALTEMNIVFIYKLGFRENPGSIPLCPDVMCGPPGLQFETYVTLSVELFGNLPVPTKSLSTKALVLCKQETSDWKPISDADGSSFIKNNRSYILTNHFTRFKTVLDQSNFDGTEHQKMRLVKLSLSKSNVHGNNEILVELRKAQSSQTCEQTKSVLYGWCHESSIIEIKVEDWGVIFHQSAEDLLNNNFSAVGYSIPCPPTPTNSLFNVYMGRPNQIFQLTPENRHTTDESDTNQACRFQSTPQTNVSTKQLKGLCEIIEQDMEKFEKFLRKYVSDDKTERPINVELFMRNILVEGDENLEELETNLLECGMDKAVNEVKRIRLAIKLSRRPLPKPTDHIQPLSSSASGNNFPIQGMVCHGPQSDFGPQALSFGVNKQQVKEFRKQPGNENTQEQRGHIESPPTVNPCHLDLSPDEEEKRKESEELNIGISKQLMESPSKDDIFIVTSEGGTSDPDYENVKRRDLAGEKRTNKQVESPYVSRKKTTGQKK